MDYTIIITLLLAALVGNLFNDIRNHLERNAEALKPQIVNKVVTVTLSSEMTFYAAHNVCELCGWRLVRRGRTLYLQDAMRNLQHSAVMIGGNT